MIYHNIQDIPYQFLKDAVLSISKKYNIEKVRTDPYGEVFIKCPGKLSDSQVKDILEILTPGGLPKGYTIKYDIDYIQEETGLGWRTYIYSLKGIDYRTILNVFEERKYLSIKDIPYTFLHNALLSLVKDYNITSIIICDDGGLLMDIMEHISETQVKDICLNLCPKSIDFEETFKDIRSLYTNHKEPNVNYTSIAINKIIDYTKL